MLFELRFSDGLWWWYKCTPFGYEKAGCVCHFKPEDHIAPDYQLRNWSA